jgi:hypothetical protein
MQTEYKETIQYEYEIGDIVTCYASWFAQDGETAMPKVFPGLPWGNGGPRDRATIEAQRMNLEITNKFNTKLKIAGQDTWGNQYTCFVHWSNHPAILTNSRVQFFLSESMKTQGRVELLLNPGSRGAPKNPYQISNIYGKPEDFNNDASSAVSMSGSENILCNERRLRKMRRLQVFAGKDPNKPMPIGWDYNRVLHNPHAQYQDWFYLITDHASEAREMIESDTGHLKMNRWTFVLQTRGSLIKWIKETVEKLNGKKSNNLFGANGYATLGVQRDDCAFPTHNEKYPYRPSWDKSIEFLYDEPEYLEWPERPVLLGFFPFTALKADSKLALNKGQHTNNTSANVFQVVCKAFPVDTEFNDRVPIPMRTWVLTWNENELKNGPTDLSQPHKHGIDLRFIDSGMVDANGHLLNDNGEIVYSIEKDFYKFRTSGRDRVLLDSRNTALRESWFKAIVKMPDNYYNKLWNSTVNYSQTGSPTPPSYWGFDLLDDTDSYDIGNSGRGFPTASYHVTFGIIHKNVDVEILLPQGRVNKRIFVPMTYISPDWPDTTSSSKTLASDLVAMMVKSIFTRRHCSGWDPVNKRYQLYLKFCARQSLWEKWCEIDDINYPDATSKFRDHCRAMMAAINPDYSVDIAELPDDDVNRQEQLYEPQGGQTSNQYLALDSILEGWATRINPESAYMISIMTRNLTTPQWKPIWLKELITTMRDIDEQYLFRLKPMWPKNENTEDDYFVITDIRLLYINPLMKIDTYDLGEIHSRIGDWDRPGDWRIQVNLSSKEFEDNGNNVYNLFKNSISHVANYSYTVHKGLFSRTMPGDRLNTLVQKDQMVQREEIIIKGCVALATFNISDAELKNRIKNGTNHEVLRLKQTDGDGMLKIVRDLGINIIGDEDFKYRLEKFRRDNPGWSIKEYHKSDRQKAFEDYHKSDRQKAFEQPLQGHGVLEFLNAYWPIENETVECPDNQTLGWFLWNCIVKGIAAEQIELEEKGEYEIIKDTIHSIVLYFSNDAFEQGRITIINKNVVGSAIDPSALDTYQGTFKKEIIISALTLKDLSSPMKEYLKHTGFDPDELALSQPVIIAKRSNGGDSVKWFDEQVHDIKVDVCLMPVEESDKTLVDIHIRFAQGTHKSDVRQMTDVWVGRPKYKSFPLLSTNTSYGEQDTKFMQKVNSVHPPNWRSNMGYTHCRKLIEHNVGEQYKQYLYKTKRYGEALTESEWRNQPTVIQMLKTEEEDWWIKPCRLDWMVATMVVTDTPKVNWQLFDPSPVQMAGLTKHSEYVQPDGLVSIESIWEYRAKEVLYHFIYAKKFLNVEGHGYWDWSEVSSDDYRTAVVAAIESNIENLPNPFLLPMRRAGFVMGQGTFEEEWNAMTMDRAAIEVYNDNHGKVGELLTALTQSHYQRQFKAAHDEWNNWPVQCKKDFMRATVPPEILEGFKGYKPLRNLPGKFMQNLREYKVPALTRTEYTNYKKSLLPTIPLHLKVHEKVYWDKPDNKRRVGSPDELEGIVVTTNIDGVVVRLGSGSTVKMAESVIRRYQDKFVPDERDDENFTMFSGRWVFLPPYSAASGFNTWAMFSEYDCVHSWSHHGHKREYKIKRPGVINFISSLVNRKMNAINLRLKACNKLGIDNAFITEQQNLMGLTTVQEICHRVYEAAIQNRNEFTISGREPLTVSSVFGTFSEHRDVIESIEMTIAGGSPLKLFHNNKFDNGLLYDSDIKEVVNSNSADSTQEQFFTGVPMNMRRKKLTFNIRFKDEDATNADFCLMEELDTLIKQKGETCPRRGIITSEGSSAGMVIGKKNQWSTPLCAPDMIQFLHITNRLINESLQVTLDYMEAKKIVAVMVGDVHQTDEDGEYKFKAISLSSDKFNLAGTLGKIESVCRQLIENAQKESAERQHAIEMKLQMGEEPDELEYEEALVGTPMNTTKCRICNHLGATVFLPQCTGSEKHVYHMQCIHEATIRNYGVKGLSKELIMVNLDQYMVYHQTPPPPWDKDFAHGGDVYDIWFNGLTPGVWALPVETGQWIQRGRISFVTIRIFLQLRAKMVAEGKLEAKYSQIIPLHPDEAVSCGLGGESPAYFWSPVRNRNARTLRGWLNEGHQKQSHIGTKQSLKTTQMFVGVSDSTGQFRDNSGFSSEYHGRAYTGLGAAVCTCTRPYGTRIWCVTPVGVARQYKSSYSGQNAKEYNVDGYKPFTTVTRKGGVLDIESYKEKYMLFSYQMHGRAENFPDGAEYGRGALEQSDAYDSLITDYEKGYNVPQFFEPIGYFPKEHDKNKYQRLEGDPTVNWKEEVVQAMKFRSYTIPETGESLPDITKIYEDPTIRKQLNAWLEAAQAYLIREERKYVEEEKEWHKSQRADLIKRFKPVDGLGRPSNKLVDIESKWVVKPTFRGGAIPKKYALREDGIPMAKWRTPRTFELVDICTVEDFILACYENIENMYEIPTVPVWIPETKGSNRVPWEAGDVYVPPLRQKSPSMPETPYHARPFYPYQITFKEVDFGHFKGLHPYPGDWADIPIYTPSPLGDMSENHIQLSHLNNLKKRLRKWTIVKCRDMRSGLGHVDADGEFDPSKALFYNNSSGTVNAEAKEERLREYCKRPLLDRSEGDRLPWPNPTNIFTPTVDVVDRRQMVQDKRFKIEIRYEMIETTYGGGFKGFPVDMAFKGFPVDMAKAPMVVDVGLDDEVAGFASALETTQWWGKASFYNHTAEIEDAAGNLVTQPIFPNEDTQRAVFSTERTPRDFMDFKASDTSTYDDEIKVFPASYCREKVVFMDPETGARSEPEFEINALQSKFAPKWIGNMTWNELFYLRANKIIGEDISWGDTPSHDNERTYAKLGLDDPWKCSASDTFPSIYVDPFTSTKYIVMIIRVPVPTRFSKRLNSQLWKLQQMKDYNLISPSTTVLPVKVETFDQEEHDKFYYPQVRALEIWAAMPLALLDNSMQGLQGNHEDWRDSMKNWADLMNFSEFDVPTSIPQNQMEAVVAGHAEELVTAQNLYTDCYNTSGRPHGVPDEWTRPDYMFQGFELAAVSIVLCCHRYNKMDDGVGFHPLHRLADDINDDEVLLNELEKRGLEKEGTRAERVHRLQTAFNAEESYEIDSNDDIKLPWIHRSFASRSWCSRAGENSQPLEGLSKYGDKEVVLLPRTKIVENKKLFNPVILDRDMFYQYGINIIFEPTTMQVTRLNKKMTETITDDSVNFDIRYRWKDWNIREKLVTRGNGDGFDGGWLDDRHSYLGDTRPGRGVGRAITYQDCDTFDLNDNYFRTKEWMDEFIKDSSKDHDHTWKSFHVEQGLCPAEAVGKSRTFIKVKVFRHVPDSKSKEPVAPPPLDKTIRFQFYNLTSAPKPDWCPFWKKWGKQLRGIKASSLRFSKMHRLRVPGRGYNDDDWPDVFKDLKKVYILEIMYAKHIKDRLQNPLWEIFMRSVDGVPWKKMEFKTEEEQYKFLDDHISVKMACLRPQSFGGTKWTPVWMDKVDCPTEPPEGTDGLEGLLPWPVTVRAMFDGQREEDGDYYNDYGFYLSKLTERGMFGNVLLDDEGNSISHLNRVDRALKIRFNRALFTDGRKFLGGAHNYGREDPVIAIVVEFTNNDEIEVCVENVAERDAIYDDFNLKWCSSLDNRYSSWSEEVHQTLRLPHLDDIAPRVGDVVEKEDNFFIVSEVDDENLEVRLESSSDRTEGTVQFAENDGVWMRKYKKGKFARVSFVSRGLVFKHTPQGPEDVLMPGDYIQLTAPSDITDFVNNVKISSCWYQSYDVSAVYPMMDFSCPVKILNIRLCYKTRGDFVWRITMRRVDPQSQLVNEEMTLDITGNDRTGWWFRENSLIFRKNGTDNPPPPQDPRLDSSSSDDDGLTGYQQSHPAPQSSTDESAPEDLMKRLKKLRF